MPQLLKDLKSKWQQADRRKKAEFKVPQAFVSRFYELGPGYFKVKQEMVVIPRAAG